MEKVSSKDMPLHEGNVYLIDYGDGKTFKLGMTINDVEKRLKTICRGSVIMPMQLVMSGYSMNCRQLENLLHLKYQNVNKGGEWFSLTFVHLVEIYQILELLTCVELYNRWYELVPDDHQKYIEHFAISSNLPQFIRKELDIPVFN